MYQLSKQQISDYHSRGYVIVRSLFDSAEIERLYAVAIEDASIKKNSYDLSDQQGKRTKLALWYTPGNDIYGMLTRTERMVRNVDLLMEDDSPVCHFHSKLMQKEPKVGGAWEWHQDYGYWYKNEFLYPNRMMSVMIAISEANKQNGCLQVIEGSHQMGRVEHGFSGEQVGASQRYVDLALETMPHIYVELKPGDALFFHSNLLHRSEANLSDTARWSLISCYNRQSNPPYNEKSSSSTVPLETVPDDQLLAGEVRGMDERADFLRKDQDLALK